MKEVLQQLLAQSDILTEDTKTAIITKLDEVLEEAKETARAEITAELHEQWATERTSLIEALDLQVHSLLETELDELRESAAAAANHFRDLEGEYATQLVEAREELKEQFEQNRIELIEGLDAFLEMQLETEIGELRDELRAAQQNRFGRQIFEAFVEEFRQHYVAEDSIEGRLIETEARLEDALTALAESEETKEQLIRNQKMESVLESLEGRNREVMEAILKNVETEKLEEMYSKMIGRVLKESTTESSEKENQVLAEGKSTPSGVVKNGDTQKSLIQEQLEKGNFKSASNGQAGSELQTQLDEAAKLQLRRIAGIA